MTAENPTKRQGQLWLTAGKDRQPISTPDHVGAVARIGKPRDETGNDNARHLLRRWPEPRPGRERASRNPPINK